MNELLIYPLVGVLLTIILYVIKPLRFIPKWTYTALHELGHSTFSSLAGQGFQRIKLNGIHDLIRTGAHGSSEVRKPKGWTVPGIIVMSLAGYVFPIQVALWLIIAIMFNLTLGMQITLFAIPILLLLFGRNLGALYYSLISGAVIIPTVLLTLSLAPLTVNFFAGLLASILLFEGVRSLIEVTLIQFTPGQSGQDDLGNLAAQFGVSSKFWLALMVISLSVMIIAAGVLVRYLMLTG